MEETDTLVSFTFPSMAMCEWQSMIPGITYWPVPSITEAPGGTRTFSPTSAIFPSRTTMEPLKVPLDTADKLLTVGTDLAMKLGLATGKANTLEQLAGDRNLNITEILHSGLGEAAIAWLNGGFVRMILIMIFGTAIYAALHAPGHGTAEALAVTTLGLLLGVPLLAGYATWWEITLILGGLAMIAFEIFVFPHAGLMIVGGMLMMVVGLVMTFVGSEPGGRIMPHMAGNVAALKHGLTSLS